MSQIIEGKDAVVLVMSREEAELLGSFRYQHVGGDCALYKVMFGLPFKQGGSFYTEASCADGKTLFHDWIPGRVGGAPKPSSYGSVVGRPKPSVTGDFAEPETKSPYHWIVECNIGVGWEEEWRPSGNPDIAGTKYTSADEAMRAVRGAPWFNLRAHEGRYRAAPVYSSDKDMLRNPKPEPKKWVVQYNHSPLTNSGSWETLNRPPNLVGRRPAEGVYTSRNEAYRQLKLRAKRVGAPESLYRVVPEGTKDGAETDRGYYRGQFWNTTTKAWQDTADVVRYRTAEKCRRSIISKTGLPGRRVKWYPNVA